MPIPGLQRPESCKKYDVRFFGPPSDDWWDIIYDEVVSGTKPVICIGFVDNLDENQTGEADGAFILIHESSQGDDQDRGLHLTGRAMGMLGGLGPTIIIHCHTHCYGELKDVKLANVITANGRSPLGV